MSRRLRLTLAILGLVIVCLSLTAVLYSLWPVDTLHDRFLLAPTFFAPPTSAP
jgi:hypothetical protein